MVAVGLGKIIEELLNLVLHRYQGDLEQSMKGTSFVEDGVNRLS